MSSYIFQFELPEITNEIAEKVPAHREHINQLFIEGRIVSYSVSLGRNFIWCVLVAENEQEAMEVVAKFPLHPYFIDISCHPLLFHNTQPASLPDISLN